MSDRKQQDPALGAETSAETDVKSLRRRRVLGAAGSLPAVMTLYSGAARANLSHFQCIANAEANQRNLPLPNAFKDTRGSFHWKRVNNSNVNKPRWSGKFGVIDIGVFRDGSGQEVTLVEYEDSGWTDSAGKSYTITDPSADPIVVVHPDSLVAYTRDPAATARVFSAVYVDERGRLLGADPSNAPAGTAVAKSCWTSFT